MHLLHFFRSASSLASDSDRARWGRKAVVADATSRNHPQRTGGPESEEGKEEGPREREADDVSQQDSSVTGSFLAPWPRSPSPLPSKNGSSVMSASELPSSEYNNMLDSPTQKHSGWELLTFRKQQLRHSYLCWGLSGLAMVLLITLLTTLLVLNHVRKAEAKGGISATVDLGYAKYQGIPAKDSKILQWRGIRYAAPPVGDLRFKAPQPPIKNDQLQKANNYGATCLPSPSTGLAGGSSEDCLFLNVYAPTDDSKTRPVFVYIQGGGFNTNASPNQDGTALIQAGDHDMVVVNFNYRVGPWGFLASKEVKAGGDCNAGNLDQRFVLQWVQKYIHLFGGDPKRVTLGGASAGAASVDLHLSAYGGRDDGLFHAVAAESQSFGAQLTYQEAQYQYDGLVERTGCKSDSDTLACLRKLDVKVLAQNNAAMPTPGGAGGTPVFMYSNVVDGDFTQDYTYNMFATGRYIKVPALMGDDTNEGTIFTPKGINNYTEVNNFLKNNFVKLTASQLAQINHLYPKAEQFSNAGTYWRTAANAYGDMRYNCPGIWMASIFHAGTPVWNYHWDVLSTTNAANGLGVTHVADGQAVWGLAGGLEGNLNGLMTGYWQSFIRTHDPNKVKPKTSPTWEQFGSSTSKTGMQRIHFVNDPKKAAMEDIPEDQHQRCSYLSTIGGSLGQ